MRLRPVDECLISINVNETVWVKLTKTGEQFLKRQHDIASRDPQTITKPFKLPKTDDDGYSQWQLWSLMETFGGAFNLAIEPPFDTTIYFESPNDPPRDW